MAIITGMEFTEAVRQELTNNGYTHIVHDPAKKIDGDENYIHWIEPIKPDDPRQDFEEAELYIQPIDDFEVVDMAAGMVGVTFKIKTRHVV